MKAPLVLGHRGAPRMAPENTLAAFDAALAQGADGVELDVRLTRTGELVVCHDATLARLAGAAVRVAASSHWSLARYDLGQGQRVPTLDAVLDVTRGRVVNVEVKADDGAPVRLAWAVAEVVVRRARDLAAVVVSSFEPAVLFALRTFAPQIPRGLLVPSEPLEAADILARATKVLPQAIHPHHRLCTPERVAEWHARGLKVNTWTVDNPDDVARVAHAGVDAIITNEPASTLAKLSTLGLR